MFSWLIEILMTSDNKNKQIADNIIDILQGGLVINADTQHYIDSTFSHPSIDELESLLQEESSCETDSLMELLFYPDESVQLQLEGLLEDTQLQPQDEEAIHSQICSRPLEARFLFDDNRGTLKMRVSPIHIDAFIKRLNLTRPLDLKISAAIGRHVRSSYQARCKVKLRNAKPITTTDKTSFLELFFEKMKSDDKAFFEYLDFILGFLGDHKNETDIYKALMNYKKIYLQGLQKAAKLDRQIAKHNVETLLLSGTRLAYMDKADARKKIQIIDRISLAVFGKTDSFDLLSADNRSIHLQSPADIDKLIEKLD